MVDLSIIIPAYRAAAILDANLPGLIQYLRAREITAELIIVDDGSEDAGASEAVAQRNRCRFIRSPKNEGKGAAVRRGMAASHGHVCIFTDADIPFQFESIEHFFETLRYGEYDIAIGDRTLQGSSYFASVPLHRRIASALWRLVLGRRISRAFPDSQCGLKAFNGPLARQLFAVLTVPGFAFDVEILFHALAWKLKVKRLPVRLRQRGASSVRLLFHGPEMLRDIFALRARRSLPPRPPLVAPEALPLRAAGADR